VLEKLVRVGLLILLLSAPAVAQPIPNMQACSARHAMSGQVVPVRQRIGPSPFWAHANWDMDGWPAITYGPAYFSLPALMQSFTSAHECGHLVLISSNEFVANCFALQNLPLSSQEKQFVARYHESLGPLGPQYGGSGAAFWAMTRRTCPDDAE
jgi:hypothetical protein